MTKALKMLAGLVIAILVVTSFMFSAAPVCAQNPPPPDEADESWSPPGEGGEPLMPSGVESRSGSAYCSPPYPGAPPSISGACFVDEAGQVRTHFGDEAFYLQVQVSSPGYFYVAEYFPAGSGLPPQWLIYRYYLDYAGLWILGPFYPEPSEPAGRHAWRMWLYASGAWAQRVAHFTYQPSYSYPPYPYPPPAPVPSPRSDGWSPAEVVTVVALAGALGVTAGMLVAGRRRNTAASQIDACDGPPPAHGLSRCQ